MRLREVSAALLRLEGVIATPSGALVVGDFQEIFAQMTEIAVRKE